MSGNDRNEGAWFAPTKYGIGAGPPIAPQGWAVLSVYMLVMGLCALLIGWDQDVGLLFAIPLMIVATLVFIIVAAAKTRGGWRWRWGDKDS